MDLILNKLRRRKPFPHIGVTTTTAPWGWEMRHSDEHNPDATAGHCVPVSSERTHTRIMALIRTRRPQSTWPTDEALSWEARGLLAYLFAQPDDWEIQMDDLVQAAPCTADDLDRIVAELEEHGYARREKKHQYDGSFQWVTEIHPQTADPSMPDRSLTNAEQAPDRRPSERESTHSRTVSSTPTD